MKLRACLYLLALLCLCDPVQGQCIDGRPAPAGYRWRQKEVMGWGLFRGRLQVGYYDGKAGVYTPLVDRASWTWGEPCEPPVGRPAVNCGVGPRDGGEHYSIRGREASKADVVRRLRQAKAADVPDRSRCLRVVFIAEKGVRDSAMGELAAHPDFLKIKDRAIVQGFSPEDWQVARYGFVANGKPTVYVEAPDGTVLHRQDDWTGAADLLAAIVRAEQVERKPDPKYQPAADPDRRKALGPLPAVPWSVPAFLGMAGGLLLFVRRKLA